MSEMALFNPDKAGKKHRRHPRFGDVSTACGGSLIHLRPYPATKSVPWEMPVSDVPADEQCLKCWAVCSGAAP